MKKETTKETVHETVEKSDVAKREEEVLAFWNEHDIFNKSLAKESPKGDFVFYDGPPFATGTPHYGHILAGTMKDAIPRFRTMQGYHVARKWGWDCHGLPLENLIEKRLGLATKRDIEEMGVKQFNEAARDAVLEYADDWRRIVPRMGRFVDMENDYRTMDSSYTESVWWVFSELNKKGLVYEGFKSMHLCPRCGTTLSNFEVNQGYKDIKDIAVTVKLPLADEPDTSLLVWTTTPWTLPGNMAAAVHNDIEYVKVRCTVDDRNDVVILAKERLAQLGTEHYEILETMKGSDLVGRAYVPPFDVFKNREILNKENAWKIYHADYVELGAEGTGAVHIAPAYGEEDMELAKRHAVPAAHHVDDDGRFMDFVTHFSGQLVKPKDDEKADVSHLDSDIEVVKRLKDAGLLLRKENITHSYPHCWRCDTPLLNYATTSWFVRVTDIKDKLVAENIKINWVPDHVGSARFGNWLEGARDWAVSRQRYWGAPIPVWRKEGTQEYKVLGSLEDLKQFVPKSGNTYVLMRHGEAESNLNFTINADPSRKNPLTEKGRAQVRESAAALKDQGIDLIIHSEFERTRDTARIVAEELGLAEDALMCDPRLNELQAGPELEGKNWMDYEKLYPNNEDRWFKHIDGVENRREHNRRLGEFLYEIDRRYAGKTILFVGHVSSLNALRYVAAGADQKQADHIRHTEKKLGNGSWDTLAFTPIPHNEWYELDFHVPYIDQIILRDTDGTRLVRVPDVFDCWFESGSMPYAQNHYPFENLETFNADTGIGFPANFIAEGIDQTRGWFYSLIVLGTALFGKSPYQNVIVNGLVLAEDGKKMSKSLQNYPDPMDVADRVGVDAMRFYLLSSPAVRGEDLRFSEKEVLELQRKNIGRLHNVLAMYEMFANGTPAHTESTDVLDRWILARLAELIQEVTKGYEGYELDKATRPITDFVDDVSVWYLRRSRDRLKGDNDDDKALALATLRHVLKSLALVMAPAMPFYAEYLWQRVKETADAESVHLASWPESGAVQGSLIADMREVRKVVTAALEARTKANIKVRQPLQRLEIFWENQSVQYMDKLIEDELNVKNVVHQTHGAPTSVKLDTTLTPELIAEGVAREFIRAIQDLRKKNDLQPADRIALVVEIGDEGQHALKAHTHMIMKTVGAVSLDFASTEGVTLALEYPCVVQLTKV
jgi:isoleucyl-tRNA synthetase